MKLLKINSWLKSRRLWLAMALVTLILLLPLLYFVVDSQGCDFSVKLRAKQIPLDPTNTFSMQCRGGFAKVSNAFEYKDQIYHWQAKGLYLKVFHTIFLFAYDNQIKASDRDGVLSYTISELNTAKHTYGVHHFGRIDYHRGPKHVTVLISSDGQHLFTTLDSSTKFGRFD